MRAILVPTDFSSSAFIAAHFAVELAHALKAKIVLVNTFQIPMPPPDSYVTPISYADVREDSVKQLKKMADTELRINKKYSDLIIEYEALLGDAANEIVAAAKKHHAEMIVMGTHGASGVIGKLIGTTTASVIAKAQLPVLAIPEKVKFTGFKKITLALDLKDMKKISSLSFLIKLAELFNSHVDILSVVCKSEEMNPIKKKTENAKKLKVFENISHTFHIIVNENIRQGIESFIDQAHSEVLVTMPQKHNFMEFLFNKSITRGLAFQIKIPLLCLPPHSK